MAIAAVDALARATRLKLADVELIADRQRGRRGIRCARSSLGLVDAGAESPRETWLRLLIIRGGLPRPQTQIAVRNEYGVVIAQVDMGWEEHKIAIRNERRDAKEMIEESVKEGELAEDEGKKALEKVQIEVDAGVKKVDEIIAHKEKDLMQV